jgi:hypothetical protein
MQLIQRTPRIGFNIKIMSPSILPHFHFCSLVYILCLIMKQRVVVESDAAQSMQLVDVADWAQYLAPSRRSRS